MMISVSACTKSLVSRTVRRQNRVLARGYKGEANTAPPVLSAQEEKLLSVARPKSHEIYNRHIRLPELESIPASSWDPSTTADSVAKSEDLALEIRRKRLVYRAKQRGWLEVDLLLGTYASEHVPTFNHAELDQFEAFVNLETIDIYNVITLRLDIPDDMKTADQSSVVERIQAWARNSPLGKADPETYKSVKTSANLI